MGRKSIKTAMVSRAAELFLEDIHSTVEQLCEKLNSEMQEAKRLGQFDGNAPQVIRENFYRLIKQARQRHLIKLVPPLDESLAQRIAQDFGHNATDFTVVETLGKESNAQVAARAAELVLDLLKNLHLSKGLNKKTDYLTIGLGPGRGTFDFCRELGTLLSSDPSNFNLSLVAISAGAPAHQPEYASSSFYNLFPPGRVAKKVGLFAETLVAFDEFTKIQDRPGISEAFDEIGKIDVVVTSMGDLRDPHDLLGKFLDKARTKGLTINRKLRTFLKKRELMMAQGTGMEAIEETIGSVQYRPYTDAGPIEEDGKELRACTLFELKDFKNMVHGGGHVILIARQCGNCGLTRARALRPLLENPDLKVWSRIVMDIATAKELLACGTTRKGAGTA
jgi:hypothetical protein